MTGLIAILFLKKENQFRLFGFIYLIVILLLIIGRGKPYYSLGLYPILFVFGAYVIEKYFKKYLIYITVFLIPSMFVALYVSLSFDGIPFISFEDAVQKDAFRWEDGVNHDIPQDLADMTGWTQLGQKVGDVYLGLDPPDRENCDIFCYHYGQAGAVMFHGKDHNIPQPISFNGSFAFWAPESLTKEYMIWVHFDWDDEVNPDSLLSDRFAEIQLKAIIEDKFFRENGTRIYLCRYPNQYVKNTYRSRIEKIVGRN
jgi:hypothetical protein